MEECVILMEKCVIFQIEIFSSFFSFFNFLVWLFFSKLILVSHVNWKNNFRASVTFVRSVSEMNLSYIKESIVFSDSPNQYTCTWPSDICAFHDRDHQILSCLHARYSCSNCCICSAQHQENCQHDNWLCELPNVDRYNGYVCHRKHLTRWFSFHGNLWCLCSPHKW